jgi:hypothetical protein
MEGDDLKRFLGRLLGETYRVQRKLGLPQSVNDATLYGLLNGMENVIDDELELMGWVTTEQAEHLLRVLDRVEQDPKRKAAFKGFYEIEKELAEGGVDRLAAITILRWAKAAGKFQELIGRMDSADSPEECRRFDLDDEI